jgi:hypothetical protein
MRAQDRDEIAKKRIADVEKTAEEKKLAALAASHRPEWTNPGNLPNYLPKREKGDLKNHATMSIKERNELERQRLEEEEERAQQERDDELENSHRPEWTNPGMLPNYLGERGEYIPKHYGKTMKQRDEEEKAKLEAAKQSEMQRQKQMKSGKSNRPEFTNAANMPNYLGSARAATGRTARKKGQEVAKLFDLLDLDGDGELTRDEVVTSYEQLNMTEKEAGDFFDSLDPDRKGVLSRTEWDNRTAGLKDFVHAGKTIQVKNKNVAFQILFQSAFLTSLVVFVSFLP